MIPSPKPDREKPALPRLRARRSPAAIACTAAVLCAALFGIQHAFRRWTVERWLSEPAPETLSRAVRWTPGNSLAWRRLGLWEARQGRRETAIAHFRKALSLRAYDSRTWIALALQVELAGETQEAERYLRRALSVDTGYEPRWALANFYLRRGRSEEFWEWIRKTIEIRPRGVRPAIELCWRAVNDAEVILENAIPDDPFANRRYFAFLIDTNRTEAAKSVWPRLRRHLEEQDLRNAKIYISRLLENEDVDEALQAWNDLCARGLFPYPPISFEQGPLLTNGDWRARPAGFGFDWQMRDSEGIRQTIELNENSPGSLTVYLRGTQAESAALLHQLVPVRPGREYRFEFRYMTEDLPQESGIGWVIQDPYRRKTILAGEQLKANPAWGPASLNFRVPEDTKLIQLALTYRRAPGTTREKGIFRVTEMSLVPVSGESAAAGPGGRP